MTIIRANVAVLAKSVVLRHGRGWRHNKKYPQNRKKISPTACRAVIFGVYWP